MACHDLRQQLGHILRWFDVEDFIMAITYRSATNPKYTSQDGTCIELTVVFDHLISWAPNGVVFTATPDDIEPHGVELYNRSLRGDFGPVQAYVPPSVDVVAAFVRTQRNTLLAQTDWTQLPDVSTEIKAKWAPYRQQLRDVTSQAGFPYNITWPTEPV